MDKTPGGTAARVDPSLERTSAPTLLLRSTWWISNPENLFSSFLISATYTSIVSLLTSHSLFTCFTTSRESPYTSSCSIPRETARLSPCRSASYSASLLETSNRIWSTYLSCSPLGEVNKTSAPPPSSLSDPSKYTTKFSGMLGGVELDFHATQPKNN